MASTARRGLRTSLFGVGLTLAYSLGGPTTSAAQVPTLTFPLPLPTIPTNVLPTQVPHIGLGSVPLDPAVYLKLPVSFLPTVGAAPFASDLAPWFPPVGDQGQQSSCVAWAVGYALKSFQEREERSWSYSQDHVFSPAYIYNTFRNGQCSEGLVLPEAFEFIANHGIAPLSAMPYNAADCSARPTAATIESAKQYRVQSVKRVERRLPDIKAHIAARIPVVIALRIDQAFKQLGPTTWHGITTTPLGQHAMVIVGYDDTRQAFHLFNSWGTSWGDKGLGWVSYAALLNYAPELYVAYDVNATPPPATPPPPAGSPSPLPPPSIVPWPPLVLPPNWWPPKP